MGVICIFAIRRKITKTFVALIILVSTFLLTNQRLGYSNNIKPYPSFLINKVFHKQYRIGETRTFSFDSERAGVNKTITAKLVYKDKHTNIWVDTDSNVPQSSFSASDLGKVFENKVYPTNLKYFAGKKAQGKAQKVDIVITDLPNMSGYFDAGDVLANNSNLFYLDTEILGNPEEARNTLAHEFAHLLFYLSGRGDDEELDEKLAVSAEYLNGRYSPVKKFVGLDAYNFSESG